MKLVWRSDVDGVDDEQVMDLSYLFKVLADRGTVHSGDTVVRARVLEAASRLQQRERDAGDAQPAPEASFEDESS